MSRQVREIYEGYQLIRPSTAHDLRGVLRPPNTARFVPGPPGMPAVLVEEVAQNLINPDISTWTSVNIAVEDLGQYRFRLRRMGASGTSRRSDYVSCAPGDVFTALMTLVDPGPSGASLSIRAADGTPILVNQTFLSPGPCVVQATIPDGVTQIRVWVNSLGDIGHAVVVERIRMFKKPYPLSFTPTTRAAEQLIVPSEGLTPTSFAVEWMEEITEVSRRQPPVSSGPVSLVIYDTTGVSFASFAHYWNNTSWMLRCRNAEGALQTTYIDDALIPLGWRRLALTVDGATIQLFVDGVFVRSVTPSSMPSVRISKVTFGSPLAISAHTHANTKFADIRLSYRKPAVLATPDAPAPFVEGETIRCVRFDGARRYEVVG